MTIITKPIFVIRMNHETSAEMRASVFANMRLELPELFEQYHILYVSGENKHFEFECYNVNDIPEDIRKKTSELILDIIAKSNEL